MKILMRAQMDHTKLFTPEEVYLGNLMGGNSGNWLYQFSLFRALLKDESVTIDTIDTKKVGRGAGGLNAEYARFVNESYDCFVLPLANAFRNTFVDELRELTDFIKELKIPCIVPSIGIQALNGKDFTQTFQYRDEAYDFVSAVLEKSSMIGLRGEETARFLTSLGFEREKHFTVLGCPSMYSNGRRLPEVKPLDFGKDSLLLLNSKVEHEKKKVAEMFSGFVKEHGNYVYAPQKIEHMITSYYGTYFKPGDDDFVFKKRFYDPAKTVTFTSVPEWYGYMKKYVDLSVGTRIHGSVAAIMGGVPTFIVNLDQRVGELASFHNIAHIPFNEIEKGATIESLIKNVDFNCIHEGHAERFDRFVDFLEKNGLETAYSENRDAEKVYFDSVIENNNYDFDPKCFGECDSDEQLERTRKAATYFVNRVIDLKKEVETVQRKSETLEERLRRSPWQKMKNLIKRILKKLLGESKANELLSGLRKK